MKLPGDPIKLRRIWWDGPEPTAGDGIVTASGRRYVICSVAGKTLHCMVLAKDDPGPNDARWFDWQWAPRTRKLRSRPPFVSSTEMRMP